MSRRLSALRLIAAPLLAILLQLTFAALAAATTSGGDFPLVR